VLCSGGLGIWVFGILLIFFPGVFGFMEAQLEGKNRYLYGPVVPEMKSVGKRSLEWDLNDWKWDGDLFTATQLNSVPSDCRSRQPFPADPEILATGDASNNLSSAYGDVNLAEGRRELEKRRRGGADEGGVEMNDGAGSLNLNLGVQVYPIIEGEEKSGKKTKITGSTLNRAVCQVEDCRADLTNAKDYHRRHKVCDMHSKASKALVGNVMQRFCQQCSRSVIVYGGAPFILLLVHILKRKIIIWGLC